MLKSPIMIISVASGKGGTGKTTVSTNLAVAASLAGRDVHLLDCDVEEPNCHIFVKPEIEKSIPVSAPVPVVDDGKCTACRQCSDLCEYGAIVLIKDKVLSFPEMCHSCGGCWLVCPEGAISQGKREVGDLDSGKASGFSFSQGRLKIGEVMAPPLIRAVRKNPQEADLIIIDSPPGTSCPVITAINNTDFVVLVTEPTPFGLNDLILAVEMVKVLGIPFGILINRSDIGDDRVRDYANKENIPILLEIPNDRKIAEAYSRGVMATQCLPEYKEVFVNLLSEIERRVK